MKNFFMFTDQSRCYDVHGREISCKDQGQDATHNWQPEKRKLASRERFFKKGDWVHDALTGNIWTQDANPVGYPLTYHEAHNFIADMNEKAYLGFKDWMLPDRKALFSLISHQNTNPALPYQHPFKNVFPGYYWTSNTCSRLPDQAWYIHLGGGRVFRGMQHGSYLTWPVIPLSTFAKLSAKRFSTAAPLVFDYQNELTWLFEHRCFEKPLRWSDALKSIQEINHEKFYGCEHWRLPNIRELESLVDIRHHSPAILRDLSRIEIRSGYWSSTTSVYEPRYAWVLYTRDGEVGVGFKRNPEFFMVALTNEHLR